VYKTWRPLQSKWCLGIKTDRRVERRVQVVDVIVQSAEGGVLGLKLTEGIAGGSEWWILTRGVRSEASLSSMDTEGRQEK
jgi:hypothetical protein